MRARRTASLLRDSVAVDSTRRRGPVWGRGHGDGVRSDGVTAGGHGGAGNGRGCVSRALIR